VTRFKKKEITTEREGTAGARSSVFRKKRRERKNKRGGGKESRGAGA